MLSIKQTLILKQCILFLTLLSKRIINRTKNYSKQFQKHEKLPVYYFIYFV